MKQLAMRWTRELTQSLPVGIWLVVGALVSGATFAVVIQSIKLVAPHWLDNTPFAGGLLAKDTPTGAIVVFLGLCAVLALAMLLLPVMRRYAFAIASTLLSLPSIKPAHGFKAALLGAAWNIIHFIFGALLCALTLFVLPIGFGALAQMMGLEESLRAVRLEVNQTAVFALSVGLLVFIIATPFVVNLLARWLRTLAKHLMIGEAVTEPIRVHQAHLRIKDPAHQEILSTREREVIVLAAEGLRNKEIAQRLFVTVETVKSHISSILAKLGVDNRTQAVLKALQIGLLEIETEE